MTPHLRVLSHAVANEPDVSGTSFSPDLHVLELVPGDGVRRLRLVDALAVCQRMREALLAHGDRAPRPVQELLSGHGRDGRPLQQPHMAILPLASVGEPHGDGRLTGLALALPRDASRDVRHQVLRAVERVRRLLLGRLGVWNVVHRAAPPETWTAFPAGATHWSTVTPLVYDVHPKASDAAGLHRELAAMVARSCAHVGLPEPREVIATQMSAHAGTPPAHAFPRLRRKDGKRRHAHVIVTFDRPVMGPLLLGAGRYRGYGLLRPLPGPERRTAETARPMRGHRGGLR